MERSAPESGLNVPRDADTSEDAIRALDGFEFDFALDEDARALIAGCASGGDVLDYIAKRARAAPVLAPPPRPDLDSRAGPGLETLGPPR